MASRPRFIRPHAAAIVGSLLALPFILLFTLLMLHIEPDFGPLSPLLRPADPDQPAVLGSLIALGTLVLALAALILNLLPIARTKRAGGSLTAHPVNLVLAIIVFTFIALVMGSIIADQYPCWIGVPNCD